MPYDRKTSRLVQAKLNLVLATEALSNARVLLDHDRKTFELAGKALDQWNALYDLLYEVDRMLEDYRKKDASRASDKDGFDSSD